MDRIKSQPDPSQPDDLHLSQQVIADIEAAAANYQIDPIYLLGLLLAESAGLNPTAERWGSFRLDTVRNAIDLYYRGAQNSKTVLQDMITQSWPDISFGRSQSIVKYHPQGDGTQSVENVLLVRQWAFNNPTADVDLAAYKFSGCFKHDTSDGTPLSACVVYNAGSDRRSDPAWMADWGANVERYQECLATAERYRLQGANPARAARALGGIWGIGNLIAGLAPERGDELHQYAVALKEEMNTLLPEGSKLP